MVNVEEIEQFVVEQLHYTDIQRAKNTLEVVFKRENGESVVAITVVDGIAKVIEMYDYKEFVGVITEVHKYKSFKRLQSFLRLFSEGCITK
jgi:hypothetical protein